MDSFLAGGGGLLFALGLSGGLISLIVWAFKMGAKAMRLTPNGWVLLVVIGVILLGMMCGSIVG